MIWLSDVAWMSLRWSVVVGLVAVLGVAGVAARNRRHQSAIGYCGLALLLALGFWLIERLETGYRESHGYEYAKAAEQDRLAMVKRLVLESERAMNEARSELKNRLPEGFEMARFQEFIEIAPECQRLAVRVVTLSREWTAARERFKNLKLELDFAEEQRGDVERREAWNGLSPPVEELARRQVALGLAETKGGELDMVLSKTEIEGLVSWMGERP